MQDRWPSGDLQYDDLPRSAVSTPEAPPRAIGGPAGWQDSAAPAAARSAEDYVHCAPESNFFGGTFNQVNRFATQYPLTFLAVGAVAGGVAAWLTSKLTK